MQIGKIAELLNAEILCGADRLDSVVNSAFACDMMSDVLAFVRDQGVLLTGLCNPQVVRTAVMMDMKCIVFVRGKRPSDEVVALADESGIAVMVTEERMYASCGVLYTNGLPGGEVANG